MSSVSISVPSLESDGPRSPATATPRSYGPSGDPASFDLGDLGIGAGRAGPGATRPPGVAARIDLPTLGPWRRVVDCPRRQREDEHARQTDFSQLAMPGRESATDARRERSRACQQT